MLTTQRIIFEDDTTLNDLSNSLNDFMSDSETIALVAADDYIYIGSEHPFNSRWIEVSTVNDASSVVSVDIWSDSAWNAAVDVQDDTAVSGVTLARSGVLTWSIDRTYGWTKETKSSDVTGLTNTNIYDMYWVRLSFSVDLNVNTALKYIGFKFANDTDLGAEYPDLVLSATQDSFESGKTDWNDQHFLAAEKIIKKLKRAQIIWSPNQILEWRNFNDAAVHRCAEIIMNAFGDAYEDNRERARKYFNEGMDMRQYKVDSNEDSILDDAEKSSSIRIIRR